MTKRDQPTFTANCAWCKQDFEKPVHRKRIGQENHFCSNEHSILYKRKHRVWGSWS